MLDRFPNGRLPVDDGNPPITGAVAVTNFPPAPPEPREARALDFDADHVDVSGSEVEIVGRPSFRPTLDRFPNGRMPVDIGQTIPPPLVPEPFPKIPTPPGAVGLRGAALKFLESIAETVTARLKARTRSGWASVAAEQGGALRTVGGHPDAQSYEWSFAAAQTNQVLWAGTPGVVWKVLMAMALTDGDCTVNVACRVGWSSSGSLPSITTNGLTPIQGVVMSAADIPPGSGVVTGDGGGVISRGQSGDSLLITCDAATGGALRVVVVMYPVPA